MTHFDISLKQIKESSFYKKVGNGYRSLKLRNAELITYLKAFFKEEQVKRKFLIFGQGRTGSTLLCSILNSHPEICADLEILFHNVWLPKYYVESKLKLSSNSVYGFKVKCYQLTKKQNISDSRNFITDLVDNNWKLIYLRRSNLLKHAISNIVAKHRQLYHITSSDQIEDSNNKIYIDCDDLMRRIKNREQYLTFESEILKDLDYVEIVYERDLINSSNHQAVANRIYDFLQIESFPISTNLKRTVPENLSSLIKNYDELVSTIEKTKYAKFLPN